MLTLYGIPNCDTITKARKWLQDQDVEYQFHDFRKDGLDELLLSGWVKNVGWEALLNKRGTTWRKLDDTTKNNVDESSAIQIMLKNPAIIKRPVLVDGKTVEVGFNPERYKNLLA